MHLALLSLRRSQVDLLAVLLHVARHLRLQARGQSCLSQRDNSCGTRSEDHSVMQHDRLFAWTAGDHSLSERECADKATLPQMAGSLHTPNVSDASTVGWSQHAAGWGIYPVSKLHART